MAGGKVHVSFAASSQTHSVHQLCQTVSLAIVLLISTFVEASCRSFMSSIIFGPRLAARAKMSPSRAQNIFMPANMNSIVIF